MNKPTGQTLDLEVARPQLTVPEMLQRVIDGGITAESVGALEKLVGLYERGQARDAEKAFSAAFLDLQREMPNVKATRTIPGRDGTIRSSFAPLEEIDRQARPLCLKHGFTYSFSEGPIGDKRSAVICTLTHVGGHSRQNSFTVRTGSGPPGCSENQADGSAHSYAKRYALIDALNIIVAGIDNDARAEGGTITPEQADELEKRVALSNSNRDAFLKFAGAASYKEIAAVKYDMLDQFLAKREQRGR
jgi:hypothetical protein